MIPPTREQGRTLEAIRKLTRGGVPPSYAELQEELGIASRGGVHRLLHALKDRGLVTFEFGRARSLRIIDPDDAIDVESLSDGALARLHRRIIIEHQRRGQA